MVILLFAIVIAGAAVGLWKLASGYRTEHDLAKTFRVAALGLGSAAFGFACLATAEVGANVLRLFGA